MLTRYPFDSTRFFDGEGDGGGGGDGDTPKGSTKNSPPWASEFGDTFDPDKAWELIQNLRRNERTLKTQNTQTANKLKEIEDADKTEFQKLTEKVTALTTEIGSYKQRETEASQRSAVAEIAKKNGAIYPEDVYALIRDGIELDSSGAVTNAEGLIQNLRTSRPAMFTNTRNIDAKNNANTNGESSKGDFNKDVRSLFGVR
jgi:hypothetical protein